MWTYRSVFLIFTFGLLYSCKDKSTAQNPIPVETSPPHTKYKPAFREQTRAPSVKTKTELEVTILSQDIGRPWGITHLPDGRLLITDKTGFMQIFQTDGSLVSKVTGFPIVDSHGQGGLLDVALDPNFETNRMVYWTFSEPYETGNLTSVAKGVLAKDEKTIENSEVIFRATPAYDGVLHYGSRLVFDKDGYLFVSTGERSDIETRSQAQDLHSGLGKVVRIDTDGNPAPNNPFTHKDAVLSQIYSYGHRNVQGLALHPETGELWASEFGPKGGDELNLIKAGSNYGWPIITYGLEYSGKTIGNGKTQQDTMEQPVYYWDPSVSPSGITFYNGEIKEWKNNIFLACLSGQHIVRLVLSNNKVIGEERLLEKEGERFREVHQGKNGELYAITDTGKIYKVAKKK